MSKEPFKCPICTGRGIVAKGFYNSLGSSWISDGITEQCRSCNGTGIIWAIGEVSLKDLSGTIEFKDGMDD